MSPVHVGRESVHTGLTISFKSAGMKLNEAAANGLNNLPKLYGDDTVRKAGRVHDLKSGEKAGSEVFPTGYG